MFQIVGIDDSEGDFKEATAYASPPFDAKIDALIWAYENVPDMEQPNDDWASPMLVVFIETNIPLQDGDFASCYDAYEGVPTNARQYLFMNAGNNGGHYFALEDNANFTNTLNETHKYIAEYGDEDDDPNPDIAFYAAADGIVNAVDLDEVLDGLSHEALKHIKAKTGGDDYNLDALQL